jgi:hypothetical protein
MFAIYLRILAAIDNSTLAPLSRDGMPTIVRHDGAKRRL